MTDEPTRPLSAICTHVWHSGEGETEECPACGIRADGRVTLANLPGLAFSDRTVRAMHRAGEQKLEAKITSIGGSKVEFQRPDGTTFDLPAESLKDYFVDDDWLGEM